jgi:hypothetical protein
LNQFGNGQDNGVVCCHCGHLRQDRFCQFRHTPLDHRLGKAGASSANCSKCFTVIGADKHSPPIFIAIFGESSG